MNDSTASTGEIDRLRKRLDEMDRQLLLLLNHRMEVAKRIGEKKRQEAQFIFDPIREEAVIADLLKENTGSLSDLAIRAIFQEIFSSSRAQQGLLRIGCCGGAAGLLAAHSRFGASDHYRMARSAGEGERLLAEQSVDILVLPKEDLLDLPPLLQGKPDAQLRLTVCGEIDRPDPLVPRRRAHSGFYIVRLGAESPCPRNGPEKQKAVFLVAGGSRESTDRWLDRLGGCWSCPDSRVMAGESSGRRMPIRLWEAFDPPPLEILQERWREICGDSAWIARLGAYPVPLVSRL